MIKVLSLGAGVQSSTALLMSCKGDLPKLDAAIFADTEWEPKAVYVHLAWLIEEAAKYGIPIHVVSAGNLREESISFREHRKSADHRRFASMPFFVKNKDDSQGIVRRQCTTEYKIEPIELFIKRHILGLKPRQRSPREVVIEQWFGISYDEMHRMRQSREPWKVHRYPLITDVTIMKQGSFIEHGYTRQDCLDWLEANYPGRHVPRSACIGCPFHSDAEWASIKANPEEWQNAVEFDYAMRSAARRNAFEKFGKEGMVGELYLHRSMVPLDMVELKPKEKSFGLTEECQGMCGV
jgi:hypothetical protein